MASPLPFPCKWVQRGRLETFQGLPCHAACQREFDVGVVELLHVDALCHGCRHSGRLDDLQARRTYAMPGCHFLQSRALFRPYALCDGSSSGKEMPIILLSCRLPMRSIANVYPPQQATAIHLAPFFPWPSAPPSDCGVRRTPSVADGPHG